MKTDLPFKVLKRKIFGQPTYWLKRHFGLLFEFIVSMLESAFNGKKNLIDVNLSSEILNLEVKCIMTVS